MNYYRAYLIGSSGEFLDVAEHLCADDLAAVSAVCGNLGYGRAVEVWQQGRFVQRLDRAAGRPAQLQR